MFLEESLVKNSSTPVVTIFGSSRAREGFLPRVIERDMGLQKGQVLNLSLGGARPFNALEFYIRNREILSKSKILVVEIDSWQLSTGLPPNAVYRHFAGFHDIFAYRGENLCSLLRSAIFQLPDIAPSLIVIAKNWVKMGNFEMKLDFDEYGRISAERSEKPNYHDAKEFNERAFRYWVDRLYRGYKYSKVFERHLTKLMQLAKEDGVKTYLIQMPMADSYVKILRNLEGNVYQYYKQSVFAAAEKNFCKIMFWESASEIGLDNSDYIDWGHLNTLGAIKWSKFICNWLKDT